MDFTGYQFDKMRVGPNDDAMMFNALAGGVDFLISGIGNALKVTYTGLQLTVDTGALVARGRLIKHLTSETINVPANFDGYIVLTIDLTKQNSSTGDPSSSSYVVTNNQLTVSVVSSTQTLTKQDLFNGGNIYQIRMGLVVSNASEITQYRKWMPTDIDFETRDDTRPTAVPFDPWNARYATRVHVATDSDPTNIVNPYDLTLWRIGNLIIGSADGIKKKTSATGSVNFKHIMSFVQDVPVGFNPYFSGPTGLDFEPQGTIVDHGSGDVLNMYFFSNLGASLMSGTGNALGNYFTGKLYFIAYTNDAWPDPSYLRSTGGGRLG